MKPFPPLKLLKKWNTQAQIGIDFKDKGTNFSSRSHELVCLWCLREGRECKFSYFLQHVASKKSWVDEEKCEH